MLATSLHTVQRSPTRGMPRHCSSVIIASVAASLPRSAAAAGPKFLAIADWGGQGDGHGQGDNADPPNTTWQIKTASAMAKAATKIGADSVLMLGDNFYSNGVNSKNQAARFMETFESVYTEAEYGQIPFHVIAGNHDHNGDVSVQIAYSKTHPRWHYPSEYYMLNWKWASSSGKERTLDLLMIDTCDLSGMSDDACMNCPRKPFRAGFPPSGQMTWIESSLKNSTADFLWVAGHYPIYSAGTDGNDQTLISELLPLLKTYGAHYVNGHNHMLEHMILDGGVNTFNTGIGGYGDWNGDTGCCYDADNIDSVPKGAIQYMVSGVSGAGTRIGSKTPAKVDGGFITIEFGDDDAAVTYFNEDGSAQLYAAPPLARRAKAGGH